MFLAFIAFVVSVCITKYMIDPSFNPVYEVASLLAVFLVLYLLIFRKILVNRLSNPANKAR